MSSAMLLAELRERVEKTAEGDNLVTLIQLGDDPETWEWYFERMSKICSRHKLACVKVSSGSALLVFNPLAYSYQEAMKECLGHLRFVC